MREDIIDLLVHAWSEKKSVFLFTKSRFNVALARAVPGAGRRQPGAVDRKMQYSRADGAGQSAVLDCPRLPPFSIEEREEQKCPQQKTTGMKL